eukprot:scaffold301975_cov38-Prasinocladus_malaysianus.AAC.1
MLPASGRHTDEIANIETAKLLRYLFAAMTLVRSHMAWLTMAAVTAPIYCPICNSQQMSMIISVICWSSLLHMAIDGSLYYT